MTMTIDEALAKATAAFDCEYERRIQEIVDHMIEIGADDDGIADFIDEQKAEYHAWRAGALKELTAWLMRNGEPLH